MRTRKPAKRKNTWKKMSDILPNAPTYGHATLPSCSNPGSFINAPSLSYFFHTKNLKEIQEQGVIPFHRSLKMPGITIGDTVPNLEVEIKYGNSHFCVLNVSDTIRYKIC